jgi:hypothetical protein
MGRNVALAHKIAPGIELADSDGQLDDRLAVIVAETCVILQLAQENVQRMVVFDGLAPSGGGRERLLSLSRRKPVIPVRQ